MANFYKKSQFGRSMIEMLGVLAIIGVLSIGGIAGYTKAMSKWKINKAIDQISMIIANVQTLFSNTNDYSALREKAYSLGVFPADMKKINEMELYNAFGLYTSVYGYRNGWYLTYHIPSREACMALLTQDWGASGQLEDILIGPDDFSIGKIPVSISEAGNACKTIEERYNFEDSYIELYFN